jgi:hypothetical protein
VNAAVPSVVILLPGLGGSELRSTTGENIWPGHLWEYHNYPPGKLRRLIEDDTLQATDLIREVICYPVYKSLIDFLNSLGYREKASGGRPPNLHVFPYDWRQDLLKTTGQLAWFVKSVFDAFGGDCAITLLTHSTGGMLSRCLLESGRFDCVLGKAKDAVSQLITMGTAGRGAPQALAGILGIEGLLSLTPAQAKQLAAAPHYPSAYQHMPAPRTTALWNGAAPNMPVDLYDPLIYTQLGLSSGHVAAAADFWSTLSWPLHPFRPPRYFSFVGSHKKTLEGFLYDGSHSGSAAVTRIDTDDGGDDTVPIWSANPPGLQVQYVGGSHPFLFKDSLLMARLAKLLPRAASAARIAALGASLGRTVDASVAGLVLRKDRGRPREVVVKLGIGPDAVAKGDLVIEYRPLPIGGPSFDEARWLRSSRLMRRVPVDLPPRGPQNYPVAIGKLDDLPSGYYNAFFRRTQESKPAGQSAPFIVTGGASADLSPSARGGARRPALKKAAKKKHR